MATAILEPDAKHPRTTNNRINQEKFHAYSLLQPSRKSRLVSYPSRATDAVTKKIKLLCLQLYRMTEYTSLAKTSPPKFQPLYAMKIVEDSVK